MNIKAAIVERLTGDAGVAATGCAGIRPVQAAQDDFPAGGPPLIVYERTGGARLQTLDGCQATGTGSFAFYCFAWTDQAATDLADAVRASLLDPAWTHSSDWTVLVKCVLEDDASDGSEPVLHGMELAPYRVDLAFTITFQ
jgi:hypothetical protein